MSLELKWFICNSPTYTISYKHILYNIYHFYFDSTKYFYDTFFMESIITYCKENKLINQNSVLISPPKLLIPINTKIQDNIKIFCLLTEQKHIQSIHHLPLFEIQKILNIIENDCQNII